MDCWTRAVQADPSREAYHVALTGVLLDLKRYPEALTAADRGLLAVAGLGADGLDAGRSARLQLARARALEHTERIYEARHSLDLFAPKTNDLELLRYHAELQDVFGGRAAAAYRRLAEAMSAEAIPPAEAKPKDSGAGSAAGLELLAVLDRGYRDALRDSDARNVAWFAGQLFGGERATALASQTGHGLWVPGGLDAFVFIAHGTPGRSASQFVLDYCRTLIAIEGNRYSEESSAYRKSISGYFEQLNRLLALGVKNGENTVIALSLGNQAEQKRVDEVLDILGWNWRSQEIVEGNNTIEQIACRVVRLQELNDAF